MGVYIVIGVIYSIVCGAIASTIASNRGMEGGFGWGFFLGIIGVIVVALRPSDRAVSAYAGIEPPARPGMQDSRDAQKPSDAKARTPSKTAVFSLPNDLYAAGSPVILASNSLLKDRQTDAMSVRVALQNIGPKPIIAAQICIRPMDAAGRVLGKDIPCHYLDLNVKTGERFGGNKEFSLPDSTTREISVEVAEVIFSDKTVWQSEEEPWEPLPAPEPLTRRLGDPELVKQYRIRFGNASEIWPRAHKDLWLCACGTWNKEDGCYRCQRERAVLLALDPEELTAEKDARLAQEKADREAKEAAQRAAAKRAAAKAAARQAAEKAAAEKRKRRNRRIALTLAIIAALGAGGYFLWTEVIQPNQQYKEAAALYGAGRYQEAIAAFEALDGYKDSAAQIENCETAIKDEAYDAAVELYNAGKYEEAIAAFTAMDGYRDSAAQIEKCETAIKDEKYDAAVELYTVGKYEEAIAAFTAMDGYRDSNAQIEKCTTAILDAKYNAAVGLYNAQKYEYAIAAFTALDGYKDSAAQIEKCETAIKDAAYDAAVELHKAGKYEEAIAAFEALQGYRDSADQIANSETAVKDAAYDAAVALYNAGKYEEAIAALTALNGHKDSLELIIKYEQTIKDEKYSTAIELYNSGKYEEATILFQSLGDYLDSSKMINKCSIRTARVGDSVIFGKYNNKDLTWWVLDEKDGKLTLLCSESVASMAFGKNKTWESSSIRSWLNNSFYNSAFDTAEKHQLLKTEVSTWTWSYKILGNTANRVEEKETITSDLVYILSENEFRDYSVDSYKLNTDTWWTRSACYYSKTTNNLNYWCVNNNELEFIHNGSRLLGGEQLNVRPVVCIDSRNS